MNKRFTYTALLFALAACSITTPRDMGNAHRVFLEPLAQKAACHTHLGSLTIVYPQVPDTLDTSRIALIDQNNRLDYFAGMRWADFLPGNIQSALIDSFSASGNFRSVTSDDTVDRNRFTLDSEVKRFEAVYHANVSAPEATIEMMFTLREGDTLQVKKQFSVSGNVKAEADSADAISHAFGEAFDHVQRTAVSKIACQR